VFTPDGWLKTGDKGSIDGQGLLRITGRVQGALLRSIWKTWSGSHRRSLVKAKLHCRNAPGRAGDGAHL